MNRKLFIFALLYALGAAGCASATSVSHGSVCWSLNYAGVVVGVTTNSQTQRLLGNGVFRKGEGDTGGRYYIDKAGTATLQVVFYTDDVVGKLTISKGVDNSIIRRSEIKLATSKWFSPGDGFGKWKALHLGSTKEDVLKNLGKPKKEISSDSWKYTTTCSCELQKYFVIYFRHGRVEKIVFAAPSG